MLTTSVGIIVLLWGIGLTYLGWSRADYYSKLPAQGAIEVGLTMITTVATVTMVVVGIMLAFIGTGVFVAGVLL